MPKNGIEFLNLGRRAFVTLAAKVVIWAMNSWIWNHIWVSFAFFRFAKTLWMTSSTRADASTFLVNDELRTASLDVVEYQSKLTNDYDCWLLVLTSPNCQTQVFGAKGDGGSHCYGANWMGYLAAWSSQVINQKSLIIFFKRQNSSYYWTSYNKLLPIIRLECMDNLSRQGSTDWNKCCIHDVATLLSLNLPLQGLLQSSQKAQQKKTGANGVWIKLARQKAKAGFSGCHSKWWCWWELETFRLGSGAMEWQATPWGQGGG